MLLHLPMGHVTRAMYIVHVGMQSHVPWFGMGTYSMAKYILGWEMEGDRDKGRGFGRIGRIPWGFTFVLCLSALAGGFPGCLALGRCLALGSRLASCDGLPGTSWRGGFLGGSEDLRFGFLKRGALVHESKDGFLL